jgi:hypothetical protein
MTTHPMEELTLLSAAKDACLMLNEISLVLEKSGIAPVSGSPRFLRIMRAIALAEETGQ